ncbi:MAG: hypothetical protein LBQ86_03425 [Holophagales bacterium]|jgi:hypothetical protein|nr:hypothetical protein [Holophagales bacterium]
MIQVEVDFLIRHTMEELKDAFVQKGRFPGWKAIKNIAEDGSSGLTFLESRTIGFDLHNEAERYLWFVFSFEACGELRQRIAIPNIISSTLNIHNLTLDEFLELCRECLIVPPQRPSGNVLNDITQEHIGLRTLLKKMLD